MSDLWRSPAVPQSCYSKGPMPSQLSTVFLANFSRLEESLLLSIGAYEIGPCDHQLRANAGEIQAAARILDDLRQDARDAAGLGTRSTGCQCAVANLRRRPKLSVAPQVATEDGTSLANSCYIPLALRKMASMGKTRR